MLVNPNDHVLFYGDSITDTGRVREAAPNDPAGWGRGYAYQVAAQLGSEFADWELSFTNKGISGNRVYDLESRLEEDVLALQPNLVSILIGINDVWRRYDSNVVSNLEEFKASYSRILTKLAENSINVLILEPFLLPVPADRHKWREDLDPKIDVIRNLAREFGTSYVPLDGLFAAASTRREAAFWLPDGVHPSPAGHALIAENYISTVVGNG